MCHQLDVLLSVWENGFFCSSFYKKKKLQMDHLYWKSWQYFSFTIATCLSRNFVLKSSRPKQKDSFKHFSPKQQNHWSFETLLYSFVALAYVCLCMQRKQHAHIKEHGGLKMLDFNSPNKTRACVSCVPVLLHSFLWELETPSSTGYGSFVFWLTTGVAHGEPCCHGDCFIYMVYLLNSLVKLIEKNLRHPN